MSTTDPRPQIEALWRIESPKLIARLARITRDVGVAEELAQDTFVAAMEEWEKSGPPGNPAAWLMQSGKNRAIDHVRRRKTLDRKVEDLRRERPDSADPQEELDAMLDDDVGDDLLRLIFTACHPVLPRESRVALTLRLVAGLSPSEIARAFLTQETTVQQRIVRAKRTLTEKHVEFETPRGEELSTRLASVLEVIYLVFNEGYTATAGSDWMRPTLCEDALRLGRVLAELAPAEPEVHGLVALMEIQASRARARTAPDGSPVLLPDQDRSKWDRLLITRGLAALDRAARLGLPKGPYQLQAEIAACHARAATPADTDWPKIADLYADLMDLTSSPVIELNRAVAISMAYGPARALAIVDSLVAAGGLDDYHLLPSVRGDLLVKLGRLPEARAEFQKAASLTRNDRERALLLKRAHDCGDRNP